VQQRKSFITPQYKSLRVSNYNKISLLRKLSQQYFFSEWNISKGLAIITRSHIPKPEVSLSGMAGPAFSEAQTLANVKVIITLSVSDNDLEREI